MLLAALFLLASCTPAVETETASATLPLPIPTTTSESLPDTAVPGTLTPTQAAPASTGEASQITLTLSQPSYYTTETVTYTVTNRLDQFLFMSITDCGYGGVQRLEGDRTIPLTTRFSDRVSRFKHRLAPGESLACQWGQDVYQNPAATEEARFLDVNTENGRRLPVPPGDYRIVQHYYLNEEDVGQENKAHTLLSSPFTILPPPFREQLAISLKSEYRLGEPIGYTIRNIGKPREWSGPIFLHGPGCGSPVVERLDGSTVVEHSPQGEQPAQNQFPVGPSRLCTLDPHLWAETLTGTLPLPPGSYRLGLTYELAEALAPAGERIHQVFSAPFTVTGEPLPAVTVTIGQLQYAIGESIDLTIANNTEAPIYTYSNCGEPPVWQVNGHEIDHVVFRITEDWVPARPLPAGESWSCTWDQQAYEPHLPDSANVPPGTYQLRLYYYLSDPEELPRGEGDPALLTVSRPFVIGEP